MRQRTGTRLEILSDLRSWCGGTVMRPREGRSVRATCMAIVVALVSACSAGVAPAVPTPSPQTGSGTLPPGPPPLVQTTWPARTREHLDMWLHGYALITQDTTLIPYFRRGYRDRISAVRRQRGVTTLIETNRAKLLERIALEPSLATSGQFLPLYFSSWDQMRQAIDLFMRAGGNPGAANDAMTRTYLLLLGDA